MLTRDRQRLLQRQRDIARGQLAEFLAWALKHACDRGGLVGTALTQLTTERALAFLQDELYQLADAGAFRFFGIASGYELGAVPLAIGEVARGTGVVAIVNLKQATSYIMAGGSRAAGWVAPGELTLDDLAR